MDLNEYNRYIEDLRLREFPQLLGTTYLDHAGTTLYAQSLIDHFSNDLKQQLFGNPHSASPSSDLSTQRVNEVRQQVLTYFNADKEHFDVVFVANATAAIKLVLNAFERQSFHYGYHRDCHTSLVGVRECSSSTTYFESDEAVEKWISEGSKFCEDANSLQLFAYPAQSNMTGHRLDLSWSKRIRSRNKNMHILLDAASYLTTGRLDFSNPGASPDFTALSFYKIFGFPDLGALIVRKQAASILKKRKYFGGGTVDMIINGPTPDVAWHAIRTDVLHEALEDGTLPFHNVVALGHAVKIHEHLFGTAEMIRQHTARLVSWLYQEMQNLRYSSGQPLVKTYKDCNSTYGDSQTQGPIIAFNVLDQEGRYIGKSQVEKAAIACGVQLRTGGVCNPGGAASMLDLKPWEMRRNFTEGMRCGDAMDLLGGKPTGIVRVSLGPMSTMADVDSFVRFLRFWFLEGETTTQVKVEREAQWIGSIAAVEGLPPTKVRLSKPINCEAVQVWENEWVIIHEGGKPVGSTLLLQSGLESHLSPESGELLLMLGETGRGGEAFSINLWDTKYASGATRTVKNCDGRIAERCCNETLNAWLSQHIGVECALARYSSKYLQRNGRGKKCVKAGCDHAFETEPLLKSHLAGHASELDRWIQASSRRMQQVPGRRLQSWIGVREHPKLDSDIEEEQEFMAKSVVEAGGFRKSKLNVLSRRLRCF